MTNRIKAPLAAVAGMLVLSGCGDLLDVDNPNSLVEESIQQQAAANGVANGALWHVSQAIADVWEGPAVTSDNLYWIGSRDAWGALDEGFISDNANEFTDAAFPTLGQAVWVAQNAVEILEGHTQADNGDEFQLDFARTLMFRGMVLMVVAEQQSDMTFSYKQSDGAPVSSGSASIGSEENAIPLPTMDAVMGLAITSLTSAKNLFATLSEDDLELEATALLARAEMSRVIMANRSTAGGALAFPNAIAHANEVLATADTDYRYNLSYSAASAACDMCGNVNDRKENQVDLSLVTVDASNDIDGIRLQDPLGDGDDLALIAMLNQWKGGSYLDSGNQYPDLTVASARLMHLILAEDALAGPSAGNTGTFAEHINNLRAIDGYDTEYDGTGDDVAILQHHRRVNTVLQGLRLQDMYRWGIQSGDDPNTLPAASWQGASDAVQRPGSMLPITLIEVRANCHLNGLGCGG
jgi:hypothetical protein